MSDLPAGILAKFSEIFLYVNSENDKWKDRVNEFAERIRNCNNVAQTTKDTVVAVDKTPQQTKKRAKRTISTGNKEPTTTFDDDQMLPPPQSLRPVRTAKTKAASSLKEAPLNTKMRQGVVIKKEKLSLVATPQVTEKPIHMIGHNDEEEHVPVASKKEKISSEGKSTNLGNDVSLEIVLPVEKPPIVLSDDEEAASLMPPPALKPRAARGSRNVSQNPTNQGNRVTRSKIKVELVPSYDESVIIERTLVSSSSTRSTRSKPRSKKKFAMPIMLPPLIKQEAIEEESSGVDSDGAVPSARVSHASSVDSGKCSQTSTHSVEVANAAKPPPPDRNTIESVYEDAHTGAGVAAIDKLFQRATVSLERLDISDKLVQLNKEKQQSPTANDATFVASNKSPANSTYIAVQPPQGTNTDTTFNVLNETMDLGPAPLQTAKTNDKDHHNHDYLISEDEDDDAGRHYNEMLQQPLGKHRMKQHNELFNPCVQSPVKKKVAAFEKHATAVMSPAVTRQTRTKTRQKQTAAKENIPINYSSEASRIPKSMTPMKALPKMMMQTSTVSLDGKKELSASTSKLAHLKKAAITTASKSLVREMSQEDLRRPMQLLADEKRKKREEKAKLAQQQREAIEREKREKIRRGIEEKEEKARQEAIKRQLMKNKAQEALQRKQLEEINRDLKLEAKKKADLRALEQQKKQEREMQEAIKIRQQADLMQQKLVHNQRLLQIKKEQQKQMKAKKYTFEMLNSDDSTDDENKPSSKRPSPPDWSRIGVREGLIMVDTRVSSACIDNLFSVEPMTVDLREIFPGIEAKMLKRNSSAVWGNPM